MKDLEYVRIDKYPYFEKKKHQVTIETESVPVKQEQGFSYQDPRHKQKIRKFYTSIADPH